ncbi:hypothetical protein, partial [Brevundimonas sp.]|uniref:hypothetical protein n=1 Tax=Brevundimonas sp. TaxID=1871086 RepID=UPI0025C23482
PWVVGGGWCGGNPRAPSVSRVAAVYALTLPPQAVEDLESAKKKGLRIAPQALRHSICAIA